MSPATYQQRLAAINAGSEASASITLELRDIAKQAKAIHATHPECESIEHWLDRDEGYDPHHAFSYRSRSREACGWSRLDNGDFRLQARETYGEYDYHYYRIPAAWVFAEPAERAKLIQAELDAIVAKQADEALRAALEDEKQERERYAALKERFES